MKQKTYLYPAIIVGSAILVAIAFKIIQNNNLDSPFGRIPDIVKLEIPILMYHYVEYNQDERDFLRDSQNVPPNVFEQQLVDLKTAGYTFITPKDLQKVFKKPDADKKYIILTFDDGFRDFYTDAYPILKKHNVPAVNYVAYNFINGQDYMTTQMVQVIANDPLIEIGSHTLNHAYLLGIEESFLSNEVFLSKKNLEEEFGTKVVSFAYPYGNYDQRAINLVREAGYTSAVTVEPGNIANSSEMFKLKRIRPGHLVGNNLIHYLSNQ